MASTISVRQNPFSDPSLPFCQGLDSRTLRERVWHAVQAFFRLIIQTIYKIMRAISYAKQVIHPSYPIPLMNKEGNWSYDLGLLPWNQKEEISQGLFFFVHGYGGSPQRWSGYLQESHKKIPEAHALAPYVPERGNCPLETAGKPLLEIVQNYVNKYPAKPLYLFGFSNGARLVTYIESRLQLPQKSSLTVVSIAGAHFGSQVVNTMVKIRMADLFGMHQDLRRELRYYSTTSQELLKQREKAYEQREDIQASHIFYASTEDEAIQPVTAALPAIQGALYRIVHGHTHSSIMTAVFQRVWQDLMA